eukprot:3819495-Heterocapsa_arctica.AAC.1
MRLVRVVPDVGGRASAARAAARHRGVEQVTRITRVLRDASKSAGLTQVSVAPYQLQELRQLGLRARQHALE